VTRFHAPHPGEFAARLHGVSDDSRQAEAGRLGRQLPDLLGEPCSRGERPSAVRGHIAQHEHQHGIVREDLARRREDLAQEQAVQALAGGRRGVPIHLRRVMAQEPEAKPVVRAVTDHPQVGRAGDHEPGTIRHTSRTQGGTDPRARIACIAMQHDARLRGRAIAEQPPEFR